MIDKVTFKNFLSLRDCVVGLKGFNVLIGPNAGGKSNFIRGLELLKNFVIYGPKGVRVTFPNLGFSDLVFGKEGDSFSISVESGDIRYSVEFFPDAVEETLSVGGEQVFRRRAMPANEELEMTSKPGLSPSRHSYFDGDVLFSRPMASLKHRLPEKATKLVSYLEGMGFFSFQPDSIRAVSRVASDPALAKSGQNLARVLLHLYLEDRETFQQVEEIMRAMVPHVREVVPRIRGDRVYIGVRDAGIGKIIEPQLISDGTLRILALVTSAVISRSLVAYEEPENFVHPRLLQSVVSLLKGIGRQVVITTHSPLLLDSVEPEDVVLVWREGGETKLRRLTDSEQVEAVRKFLEEGGTLGEAWYSGVLGEQA